MNAKINNPYVFGAKPVVNLKGHQSLHFDIIARRYIYLGETIPGDYRYAFIKACSHFKLKCEIKENGHVRVWDKTMETVIDESGNVFLEGEEYSMDKHLNIQKAFDILEGLYAAAPNFNAEKMLNSYLNKEPDFFEFVSKHKLLPPKKLDRCIEFTAKHGLYEFYAFLVSYKHEAKLYSGNDKQLEL